MINKWREQIVALMVTYEPDAETSKNISVISAQCQHLIIIDNGSKSSNLEKIRLAVSNCQNASLLELGENFGIAHALNIGIEAARNTSAEWVATFDQDSTPTPDMMATMMCAIHSDAQFERIAIAAPSHVDRLSGRNIGHELTVKSNQVQRISSTMTSGNLVRLSAFYDVGKFESSFFIDYVDHEFCLRCRLHGYEIVEVTSAVLAHSLGALRTISFLGATVTTSHHCALRRYYITRNRLVVWRRYFSAEPKWVVRDVMSAIKETIKVVMFESDRRKKMKAMILGFIDFFNKKKWQTFHSSAVGAYHIKILKKINGV